MIEVEKIKGHDIWAECNKCGTWCASGVESIAIEGCKQSCTCRAKVNKESRNGHTHKSTTTNQ